MKKRLLSAFFGLPILIWILADAPAEGVFVFYCVVQFLTALEITRLCVPIPLKGQGHVLGRECAGFRLQDGLLAFLFLGIFMALALSPFTDRFTLGNVCTTLILLIAAILPGTIFDRTERVKSLLLALIYSVLPWIALWDLYSLAPRSRYLFELLSMSWAGDTAAYLVGKNWGKVRLAPLVSPHKTWLGAVSGFLATLGTGFLFTALDESAPSVHKAWPQIAGLGVATALTGQAGDLFKSVFKRQRNVKDSGHLIPGHGGLLDRMDSILLSAPVFLFLVQEFRL